MLRSGTSLDLRAALSAEIRAAQDELSGQLSARAVHAARVRLKRARALARIGRAGAPGLAAVFDETARAAMRALAPIRELSALGQTANQTAKKLRGADRQALQQLAQRLRLIAETQPGLDRTALAGALKDLLALAQVWPEASPRQLARGARAIIGRARRARKAGLKSRALDTRHKWRRREKQRLYAIEAYGADWPERRRRSLTARICEALGKERDARLLLQHLREGAIAANDAPPPKAATRALKQRARRWRKLADRLGRDLSASGG